MSEKMRRDSKSISRTILNTTHHQNYHQEEHMSHDHFENLKLFTCNSHPALAQEIAQVRTRREEANHLRGEKASDRRKKRAPRR